MKTVFYNIIKERIKDGQYTMVGILADLETGLAKKLLNAEEYEELKLLAEQSIDLTFTGNTHPTSHDLKQDMQLSSIDASIVEIYEMILGTVYVQTEKQQERIATTFNVMARSGVGDAYLRMVLRGDKLFSEVHPTKQQEVADKLIKMGREDLIDVPEFLPPVPPEEILPVDPEVPQA